MHGTLAGDGQQGKGRWTGSSSVASKRLYFLQRRTSIVFISGQNIALGKAYWPQVVMRAH